MRDVTILAAALGLGLCLGPASAEGEQQVPNLDIEKTCSSPGRVQVQVGTSPQDSQDGCLRSERAAHDELKKRWGEFTPAAKKQCSKQADAGGFPSYVETVTCLELATGAAPAQTGGSDAPQGAAKGAAKGEAKDSGLTAEPSPKQRTNPIDTLEKRP